MKGYWKADCRRILKRIPRLVILTALNLIYVIVFFTKSGKASWNSVEFLSFFSSSVSLMALFVGLVELNAVYGDDLKTRTLQVAIGRGISRRRVILIKLLEGAFLMFLDLAFLTVLLTALAAGTGAGLHGEQFLEIFSLFLTYWLMTVAYFGVAAILTVNLQGTMIATFVYLAVASTIVDYLLRCVLEMKALRGLHLSQYLLAAAAGNFQSRLVLGTFDVKNLLIVLAYIAASYVISLLLFRHKELEF